MAENSEVAKASGAELPAAGQLLTAELESCGLSQEQLESVLRATHKIYGEQDGSEDSSELQTEEPPRVSTIITSFGPSIK